MLRFCYLLTFSLILSACGSEPEQDSPLPAPLAQFTVERINHAEFQFHAEGPEQGLTYSWHLDDGTLLLGRQPSHRFSAEGPFSVTLEVSNAAGQTETRSQTVHVRNTAPEAEFGARFDRLNVILDASPSSDVDENIDQYLWTVNGESLSGPQVSLMLNHPGELDVSLVVIDDFGAESEPVNRTIIVTGAENTPPRADADVLIEKNYVRLLGTNSFDEDGDLLTYHWQVSDGTEYEGDFLIHAFDAVGEYQITLTVDDGLSTDQETVDIVIQEMDDPSRAYRKALFEARLKFLGRCGYCHRNREPKFTFVDDVENLESELIAIAQNYSAHYLYSRPAEQNGLRHKGVIGTREIDAGDIIRGELKIWHELVSGIAEYLGQDVTF